MAFGVSLWFDPAFEEAIRGVWRAARDEAVSAKLADGAYRPHVTIGIWDRLAQPEARAALTRIAAERPVFAVRFDAFGAFSGPDPGLFVTPTVSASLRELHETVHTALGPATATADRIGLVDTPAEVELACFPFAAA